jgi:hydrogenase maturation protein HypF
MNAAARRHVSVEGVVQGVGFRPFVYRLAVELGVVGWVENTPQGVTIEVEAAPEKLDTFCSRLQTELPPHAEINLMASHTVAPLAERDFIIRESAYAGCVTAGMVPDLATCPDCLREINDPTNRRYRYPFTNCTYCGPRFSIVDALPYDRANTTMREFVMCDLCRAEYEDPFDRRFHAQPNACPNCGPRLKLLDTSGQKLAVGDDALKAASQLIAHGLTVAVKGLGGFHLMADARNALAVSRLREHKHRYEKPLAVMCPSLEYADRLCEISSAERDALLSVSAPIVLLRYRGEEIAPQVAPDNPYLGVMLPYTPLHHLLMSELGFPVVATSANISGEPIVTDNDAALEKLGGIADAFLVHDRPIARPVDDSVLMIVEGSPVMLRRARGYAPAAFKFDAGGQTIIATGAHQKNVIAMAHGESVTLSQHLGDMDAEPVQAVAARALTDLQSIYHAKPAIAACDLHPDYPSTRYARQTGLHVISVQHHYAHALACLAEHRIDGSALAVVWDGTGYGTDGTSWGGEFLRVDKHGFQRVVSLRPFPLPGGDLCAHEPRRSALGVLYALYGHEFPRERLDFTAQELNVLTTAIERGINAPLTSSMGRLFDSVAALIGLRQRCSFEAQAAMALEFVQDLTETDKWYPFDVTPVTQPNRPGERSLDWGPMMEALLDDKSGKATIAAKFHNTLTAMINAVAMELGERNVILTGGCFQNRVLLDKAIRVLRKAGFTPYWPQQYPPNDGGIALGQVVGALREIGHVSGSTRKTDEYHRC